MNLFFRLLAIVLRARFGKQTHLNSDHAQSFRVLVGDQDMFNHMTNSRYFSFTDLALINYLLRTRLWKKLREADLVPIIVHKDVSIYRMLRFPRKFEIVTRLEGWSESYACLIHEFRIGDQVTARSRTIGRFIGGKADRPTIDALIDRLGLSDVAQPPLSEAFQSDIDAIENVRRASNTRTSSG